MTGPSVALPELIWILAHNSVTWARLVPDKGRYKALRRLPEKPARSPGMPNVFTRYRLVSVLSPPTMALIMRVGVC